MPRDNRRNGGRALPEGDDSDGPVYVESEVEDESAPEPDEDPGGSVAERIKRAASATAEGTKRAARAGAAGTRKAGKAAARAATSDTAKRAAKEAGRAAASAGRAAAEASEDMETGEFYGDEGPGTPDPGFAGGDALGFSADRDHERHEADDGEEARDRETEAAGIGFAGEATETGPGFTGGPTPEETMLFGDDDALGFTGGDRAREGPAPEAAMMTGGAGDGWLTWGSGPGRDDDEADRGPTAESDFGVDLGGGWL